MIAKLNKLLADELACLRLLSQARSKCSNRSQATLLDRMLVSHAQIRAILEETIRNHGGEATRASPKPAEENVRAESLNDCLHSVESIQREIVKEISAIIESPSLADVHDVLVTVRQFHLDGARWLTEALGEDELEEKPQPRT